MYTAHWSPAIVNATCTQSLPASISAAAPPSNQLSAVPFPTLSLMHCLPPAFSRNNRNPLVRLLFVGPGGLTVKIPARSGVALTLYQKEALNSSFIKPAVGSVR